MIFVLFGISWDDFDFFFVFVMNYILGGGGFFLWFIDEVWEKCGLVYGIYILF